VVDWDTAKSTSIDEFERIDREAQQWQQSLPVDDRQTGYFNMLDRLSHWWRLEVMHPFRSEIS
jgi:hypothetical protein